MPIALKSGKVRPDIVFTARKIAVFVDGCYWHACPDHGTRPRANAGYWAEKLSRNVDRDSFVDRELALIGWRVIRLWEHVSADDSVKVVESAVTAAEPAPRMYVTS